MQIDFRVSVNPSILAFGSLFFFTTIDMMKVLESPLKTFKLFFKL